VGAEWLCADGQADMTKLTAALCALRILRKGLKICHTRHSVPRSVCPSRDQNLCRPNRESKSDINWNSATAQQL